MAFFLVGYFKELQEELEKHPLATFLCKLAFSKGKISLFFLLEGLQKLVHFQQVSKWMAEENITQQDVEQLLTSIQSNE